MSREKNSVKVDRSVLISNVVSGAVWLLFPAALGAWPLSLIGAVYVVAAGLFLAAVYARPSLSAQQEALAWALPWLGAVALWAVLLGVIEMDNGTQSGLALVYGAVLGTLCFLGWQIVAVAVRQFLSWRASETRQVAAPSD